MARLTYNDFMSGYFPKEGVIDTVGQHKCNYGHQSLLQL